MTAVEISAAETWTLTHEDRPWVVNAERRGGKGGVGGRYGVAKLTQEWREAFFWLTKERKVPRLRFAEITVIQGFKGPAPDIGACYPAFKAALDGIVDAGVIPDDTGEFVRRLIFLPPERVGRDYLTVELRGQRCV